MRLLNNQPKKTSRIRIPMMQLVVLLALVAGPVFSQLNAQTFIVTERGGFVSRVDASTNTRTVIANIAKADGIVMEDENTAIITAHSSASPITLLDVNSGSQSVIGCCLGLAQGLVLDGDGNALVADEGGNRIAKVNLTTGAISTFIGGLSKPKDIIYEDANTLLITEQWSITRYDLTTNTASTLASGLGTPIDMELDGAGNVLVAEWSGNKVSQVNLSTGAKTLYASVSQAHAILLEGSDAYILSYGSGTMLKRDASGSLTTVATGMVNPAFFVLEEVCEAPVVKQGKVLVAHQTNSSKNPCVALQVNQNSLNDHLAHGDYVITCVDDACGGSNKMMTEEEWATEVKAIPNPVNDVVVFDFNSEAAGEVMFALYDLSGKHIQQLPSALLGDGQANMIQMRLDDLAAGSYIVRVGFSNGITKNIKLIKSE